MDDGRRQEARTGKQGLLRFRKRRTNVQIHGQVKNFI